MRNTEHCDRCLPKVFAQAIGYIPLPEMTNIGDTRVDERKILLCSYHYFEAKKNCYFVVPFNRDDDPVDSFLSRVNQKHKRLRGSLRLSFKPLRGSPDGDEVLPPAIIDLKPKLKSVEKQSKVHFREGNSTPCGLPTASIIATSNVEALTCKNCVSIINRFKEASTL